MKLKRNFRASIPALLLAIQACILAGCNNAGCIDNQSALPLMGFYDYATGAQLQLDSLDLKGVGAPADSLLISAGQRVSQVYLPFRDNGAPTSFCLHYAYPQQGLDNPRLNDTITFRYTASPYFASKECGAMFSYTIHSVEFTRHLIEDVEITDSLITNIERERIKVYFRTADPDEDETTQQPPEGAEE